MHSLYRQGHSYFINGTKWWTSGAMDTRCRILILMGKTDFTAPKHKQQSLILVDIQTPRVCIKRPLTVFSFDDAPQCAVSINEIPADRWQSFLLLVLREVKALGG